jgi:hypothetical protein
MTRLPVRVAGIGFVVGILVAELLKGDSPSPTAPAAEIVDFLVAGRSAILAGAYVHMLVLFVGAYAIVAAVGWGEGVAGRLGRLGLVLTLAAITTYVFLTAAAAFDPEGLEAATVKALWQARFVSETFIAFPVALLVGSRAASESGRYRWFSAVVAATFLVGGGALARDGLFAPDGGYGFILFWLFPIWVAVTAFHGTAQDRH